MNQILYYHGKGIQAKEKERKERLTSYLKKEPLRFRDKFEWLKENSEEKIEKIINEKIAPLDRDLYFYEADPHLVQMVNIAMAVKRPLFLTGDAGSGKSELAYSIAWELDLGDVLRWPIRSRTTVKEGLYHYDAIGRLQKIQEQKIVNSLNDTNTKDIAIKNSINSYESIKIENSITLGPLGTALANQYAPRVLLIDEIDKSDIDFPNDLLHELDQFYFKIPELTLYNEKKNISLKTSGFDPQDITIENGKIAGGIPPIVIITSNEERDLSKAFIRRCIPYHIKPIKDALKSKILRKVYFKDENDQTKQQEIENDINCKIQKITSILENLEIPKAKRNVSISRLLDYFLCDCSELSENEEFIKSFFQNVSS